MKMKRIICLLLTLVMAFSMAACEAGNDEKNPAGSESNTETGVDTSDAVTIKMEVKDFGTMTLELYPHVAPITVENFLRYVDDGFYDGLTFHRVYKGFMIQGGDQNGNGSGDGPYGVIKGEFASNGVTNNLSHTRGVISMARKSMPLDSASSQFFICHADAQESLDGNYAAFGKLVDGYDVLDAIAEVECEYNGFDQIPTSPVNPVIIEKVYRAD